MIYVIGDSHAHFTFRDIPGVIVFSKRGVTLKRMTYPEDPLLPAIIKRLKLSIEDYVIFHFGEIDIRCHVKPLVTHRLATTLDALLADWTDKYFKRLALLDLKGAKVVIASVVPPASKERKRGEVQIVIPPAAGMDAERALYTRTINAMLKAGCESRGWFYLDIYSCYANENGMMPTVWGDGTIHIGNNKKVWDLLRGIG